MYSYVQIDCYETPARIIEKENIYSLVNILSLAQYERSLELEDKILINLIYRKGLRKWSRYRSGGVF